MAQEPFLRREARTRGLTDRQLAGPSFRRLFRGVYVSADALVTHTLLCRAALLLHPDGARISHHSAATHLDLPAPTSQDIDVSVQLPTHRTQVSGVRSHVCPGSNMRRHGLPVSAPVQLFIEMATELPLVDLVALGDALVKRERLPVERFRQLVADRSGRGSRAASRAAGLVRNGVDSPMETRLRLLIALAGLPEPKVNHCERTRDGHVFLRLDLSYPALRLAVEYDGRQHAESTRQWKRDIARRDWLDRHHWRVLTVVAEGIHLEPEGTLFRVAEALEERGVTPSPIRDDWRKHFS